MKCTLCNFKPSRTAFMDMQLVAKLLLEVKEGGLSVDLLSLNHGGESLLHPNFKDIIYMLNDFKTGENDNNIYIGLLNSENAPLAYFKDKVLNQDFQATNLIDSNENI